MAEIEERYIGVIEQTPEEKQQNYAFAEIVASADPVRWYEKKQPNGEQYDLNDKTWRKFPTQDQDGSGSCVAQTMKKLMGIIAYIKYKIYIKFSAAHIYMRRSNKNVGDGQGMIATDVYKIAQDGVTFEELMPSEKKSEAQLNALYETELHKNVKIAIGNYIFLPIRDIDTIASVIQKTLKGVMTWYKFHYKEWKDVPKVLDNNPPNHHSVAAVDYTLYKGEKAIVIDESWGEDTAMDGQRVITERFLKERNTHVSYPMDFSFDIKQAPEPEKRLFTKPLVFIELDPDTQLIKDEYKAIHEAQKADVIRLQDILKKEGIMPTNIDSTGLYYTLTKKAVKAFQLKYSVASLQELNEVDGKRVGDKTLAKLNALYGV